MARHTSRLAAALLAASALGCPPSDGDGGPTGNSDDDATDADADTDGDGLTAAEEEALGTDPDATDTDGDGLLDGDEAGSVGTDPTLADSDGDGDTDGDELACTSDPLDGDESCYACGWPHGDPGTLESTGIEEGDVISNMTLVDQCRESVDLWDFAGRYYILFVTAAW